ncbi:hypothetical protein WJX73_009526 [Symbiochloris irregularis]|uniref:Rubredoxin-like domain-containing protein n=1 Tax=Symbiochloris irregularis TaxID=706552 RepID=A0AAW1NL54_9CHLO
MHNLSGTRLSTSSTFRPSLPSLPVLRPHHCRPKRALTLTPVAAFTVKGPKSPKGGGKTSYICKDCGYIYEGKQSFDSLTKDYECPVCAAPKRRFKVYDNPVERNANATANRKARKENLQSGPDATQLVIFLLAGAVAVVGLFTLLNSVY